MTTRLDDVYLISSGSLENGIYKYGSYYPGFNPALTKLTDTGEINPSAIYALSNSVVFGYESPASSYVVASFEMNLPPTTNYYASEGKLRSIVFDGGNLYEAKTLSEISVAYDCDNSDGIAKGGSFSLYARKTHG